MSEEEPPSRSSRERSRGRSRARARGRARERKNRVVQTRVPEDLESTLKDLHGRIHRGAYRAQPSHHIPKPDGRLRPLGIAALEDKIVQRAAVLNQMYEEDLLGFSTGFRPGRTLRWTRSATGSPARR